MLLFISSQQSRRKTHPKRTLHLQCDVCERKYERKYFEHLVQASYHICSRKCQGKSQRVGGTLAEKKRQTFLINLGVDHPQKHPKVQQKTRNTNLERYGCEWISQSSLVKERVKQTNRERFGVDWHFQSENFAIKSQETWLAKYGVNHPMKSEVIKAKYDFRDIWRQAHATKKLNGTYASSGDEERFGARLRALYGDLLEHHVCIQTEHGTWIIDFRVGNVYVQFDGVYWHGLDRQLEILRRSSGDRDIAICEAYDRDRLQDEWFKVNNLKLVRVTDKEEKTMSDNEICSLLNL